MSRDDLLAAVNGLRSCCLLTLRRLPATYERDTVACSWCAGSMAWQAGAWRAVQEESER